MAAAADEKCAYPGCVVPGSLVCPQCQTDGLPDFHVCSNEHLHALWAEHYTAVHMPRIEQASAQPVKQSTPSLPPNAIVMAGDLRKKPGQGLLKLMEDRYFVLYPDLLVWFKDLKNAKAAKPQGCVPMFAIKAATPLDKKGDPGRFDVTTLDAKGRVFELQAADAASAFRWCEAISRCKKQQPAITKSQQDEMAQDTFWKKDVDKVSAELQKRATSKKP